MSFTKQLKATLALILINCKSFPQRIISSSISIISIACVAAVILSILALTDGMNKTMAKTGLNNTLLVMRAGAVSELQSVMFPVEVNLLANNPLIKHDANDRPIVAAEMFVSAAYKPTISEKEKDNDSVSLSLRGISLNTYHFRPNFKLVSGRKFKQGLREILIGRAIARKMPELTLGKTITLGNTQWLISGIFSDNNSVFESELWTDIGMLQSDYNRGNTIQSLRLALANQDIKQTVTKLSKQWQADPRLNVRLILEKTFFAEQGKKLNRLVNWLGLPIAFIMAIGATIAAISTMFAAIASRSKEIATYKTLGFSTFSIASVVMSEAILLATIGGLIAVLPLYGLLNNWTATTQNASNLSQIMFNFSITPSLMIQTMLATTCIGLLGGLLPAIKAMRLPITVALRD